MTLSRDIRAGAEGDHRALSALVRKARDSQLENVLFQPDGADTRVGDRLALCAPLWDAYAAAISRTGTRRPSLAMWWEGVLPLAQFLCRLRPPASRPLMVGIAGGPGAGKTNLAQGLAACIDVFRGDLRTLVVSLEDFYFSPAERSDRGLRWRAGVGSHDVDRLERFIESLDRRATPLLVPRYAMGVDDRAADEVVPRGVDFCLFEGWFVGTDEPLYRPLSQRVDFLIYLDVEPERLRRWRLAREKRIRVASRGREGYNAATTRQFWSEVLSPGLEHLVRPIASRSDLVLTIGKFRAITSAFANAPIAHMERHSQASPPRVMVARSLDQFW